MDAALRSFIVVDLAAALAARPAFARYAAPLLEIAQEDWVALDAVLSTLRQIADADGLAMVTDVVREGTHHTNAGPAMRTLLRPVVKLIHHRPQQFFRWVPVARNAASRGIGIARYSADSER